MGFMVEVCKQADLTHFDIGKGAVAFVGCWIMVLLIPKWIKFLEKKGLKCGNVYRAILTVLAGVVLLMTPFIIASWWCW